MTTHFPWMGGFDTHLLAQKIYGPFLFVFGVHLTRELVMPMGHANANAVPEAVGFFVLIFLALCLLVVRMMGSVRHLRHWVIAMPIDLTGHLAAHWVAHALLLR